MSALIFALGVCATAYGAWQFFLAGIASTFYDRTVDEVTDRDRRVTHVVTARAITAIAFQSTGIAAIVVAFQ